MSTYNGLGVPLYPTVGIEMVNQTAAEDVLTIRGASSQTGDLFVAENSSSTEMFRIEDHGRVYISPDSTADIALAIAKYTGATTDYFVAYDNDGTTERFAIEDGGNVVITQKAAADVGVKIVQYSGPTTHALQVTSNDGSTTRFAVTKNHGVLFRTRTTKPTTGLTKGEVFLLFHGSRPVLAVCSSTAANTVKYVTRKITKTLGRLTY